MATVVESFAGFSDVPPSLALALATGELPATALAGGPVQLLLPPDGHQLILAARVGPQWTAALACEIVSSPRLRPLQVLRIRRFPAELPARVRTCLIEAIAVTAMRQPRVRRVIVTVAGEPTSVQQTCRELHAAGFVSIPCSSVPPRTLVIDLTPPPAAILSAADPSLRRALRRLEALPVEFRPISSPTHEQRMAELLHATYAKSRIVPQPMPMRGMIAAATLHPTECSLIGCFLTERSGPSSLIAWEFATRQGSWATSECAAMERVRHDELTIPAGYGTLWHSMRWAIRQGASQFDLGGFTVPGDPEHQTFATISRFKSHFGGDVLTGREAELHLTPRTPAALLSSMAERLVRAFRP